MTDNIKHTEFWEDIDPATFSIYAQAFADEHGEEGDRLDIMRWAEKAFPEDMQ
jgi:hypothetical protein